MILLKIVAFSSDKNLFIAKKKKKAQYFVFIKEVYKPAFFRSFV